MRIVHTCLRYPPATGGVETYVQQIVERTRSIKQDRDVRVLTSKMRTHGPISTLADELLLNDPPYVQRLHHARTPLLSYPRLQALASYLAHHQPDIVEAYSFWYQPGDIAARYARNKGVPFIFHPMFYENEVRKKIAWQIYKRTYGRRTFAAADVVVVISPQEQALIKNANMPVKRFELISPGVDMAEFETAPAKKEKNDADKPVLLAVSRLAPGKGLLEIVNAMPAIRKEIPQVKLIIIGEDFGERSKLENIVKKQGLYNCVEILGKVSRSELVAAYTKADVLVHASYYEAFGIVLAEALAAGVPVVARNVGSVPYVVTDKSNGLLFKTEDEMIESIIKILKNSGYRQQLANHGQKHVRDNFSWEVSIKKLIALYGELIRRNQD